jgi:hypothetical protein
MRGQGRLTGDGANTDTGSTLKTVLQRLKVAHWRFLICALRMSFGDSLIGHGDSLMLTKRA